MNASILIAAVAVGVMVFARVFMGVLALLAGQTALGALVIPVAVALLILYGIVVGQRLAWQWGRLLGLLGGIILTFAAVGAFTNAPQCGAGKPKGGNFLFTEAVCRKCNSRWK